MNSKIVLWRKLFLTFHLFSSKRDGKLEKDQNWLKLIILQNLKMLWYCLFWRASSSWWFFLLDCSQFHQHFTNIFFKDGKKFQIKNGILLTLSKSGSQPLKIKQINVIAVNKKNTNDVTKTKFTCGLFELNLNRKEQSSECPGVKLNFENASTCSKRTLKTTVATQL